ncbi:MAG: PsbP-related protein [Chitinophagaceae bacterium]
MRQGIFLFFVFAALLMEACKNEQSTPKDIALKEFHIDSLGYSIKIPETWEIRFYKNRPDAVSFFEPQSDSTDSFRESLVVWTEKLPKPISDSLYKKASETEIKISNPNFKIVNEENINGANCKFGVFSFLPKTKDGDFKIYQYACVKDSTAYNISTTTLADDQKSHEALFQKIINTFTITR